MTDKLEQRLLVLVGRTLPGQQLLPQTQCHNCAAPMAHPAWFCNSTCFQDYRAREGPFKLAFVPSALEREPSP